MQYINSLPEIKIFKYNGKTQTAHPFQFKEIKNKFYYNTNVQLITRSANRVNLIDLNIIIHVMSRKDLK